MADLGYVYSDQALADIARVALAMERWRMQNDPASDDGPTMAEFIVQALYKEGRLR